MRAYPAELFDRVFRFERIDGRCATEKYLYRWTLLKLPGGRAVYLHHFVGSDWARDLHDHPKRFVTIGLRGGYVEERLDLRPLAGPGITGRLRRQFRAPWIRTFPARHVHRVRPARRGCWTLAYVGPKVREWGFLHRNRWIPWQRFREVYDERRCP